MDNKDLCEHTRIRLIAAALGHQHCTATDGTEVQIVGTGKRILIGDDAYLAKVALPAAIYPSAVTDAMVDACYTKPGNVSPHTKDLMRELLQRALDAAPRSSQADPFGTEQQAGWFERLCAARVAEQPTPGAVTIWQCDLVSAMAELLQLRAYREHHLAKQAGLQQLVDQAQELGGYDLAGVTESEGGHHD